MNKVLRFLKKIRNKISNFMSGVSKHTPDNYEDLSNIPDDELESIYNTLKDKENVRLRERNSAPNRYEHGVYTDLPMPQPRQKIYQIRKEASDFSREELEDRIRVLSYRQSPEYLEKKNEIYYNNIKKSHFKYNGQLC